MSTISNLHGYVTRNFLVNLTEKLCHNRITPLVEDLGNISINNVMDNTIRDSVWILIIRSSEILLRSIDKYESYKNQKRLIITELIK